MLYKPSADSTFLPLQFKRALHHRSWWAPVWRGLIVDRTGKHYRALHTAVWLFLYLVIHADRRAGKLIRKVSTIAEDMGVKPATVRRWLSLLARGGYISRISTGRSLQIIIHRWKPLRPKNAQSAVR